VQYTLLTDFQVEWVYSFICKRKN